MNDKLEVLAKLPVFQMLPAELYQLVVNSFSLASYSFGTPIVNEGDEADAFYVIVEGRAQVYKHAQNGDEIELNRLRGGDSFGEIALLEDSRRTATVRATSELKALKLDRQVFQALVQLHPEIKAHFSLQTKHRSLNDFFRLYSPFAKLPAKALALLMQELESITVAAGELVIRQGEATGPLYIVEEGHLRAFNAANGRRNYRRDLHKGDFFGEVSLFTQTPRTASVEAVTACRLLKLTRATLEKLCAKYPAFQEQITARIEQYEYQQNADVPNDFAEEMLPADAALEAVTTAGLIGSQTTPATISTPYETISDPPKHLRDFPHIAQRDVTDSGAACLTMLCRHFNRPTSLARIRQLVPQHASGASLRELCRTAEELGLPARVTQISANQLGSMPLPAVTNVADRQWAVVYNIETRWISLADPSQGLRRIRRTEFENRWDGQVLLFDYVKDVTPQVVVPEEKPKRRKLGVRWMWPFFRPHASSMLKVIALAFMCSALEMTRPVFAQIIIDRVLVGNDRDLLRFIIVALVGILSFMVLAQIVQRYLLSFIAVRFDGALLDFVTRKLLALPMTYFNTRRAGDIQNRLLGLSQVREFLLQYGVVGITASTQLFAAMALMFIYNNTLAWTFLSLAPLYALMVFLSQRRLKPIFNELSDAQGKYQSHQIEAIKGIETVKSLSAEGRLRELMLNQFHTLARQQFKANLTRLNYDGAISSLSFLSLILFLGAGAYQVLDGKLTIGGLAAFNFLIALANGPIKDLLKLWDAYQNVAVQISRLDDIFAERPEQGEDHGRLVPVRHLEGALSLRNVGFHYGGKDAPKILDDITIEVPAGKLVAIVGRSGSGKTTLIKCLAGLLEPTAGTILFDGLELKTLNYRNLRRQIGFVLQDNYLFNETIARNIGFGDDEPDMDRVIWAARAANVHQFAERLPAGYETRVGESGLTLSGGQKQRIAIARALYCQPPILIFDEATSALDTESEKVIKENMEKLMKGRTSFVIAHRLSTIRNADLILVLEKGRLAEFGNHDELMKQHGLYYYLNSQQLGFE